MVTASVADRRGLNQRCVQLTRPINPFARIRGSANGRRVPWAIPSLIIPSMAAR